MRILQEICGKGYKEMKESKRDSTKRKHMEKVWDNRRYLRMMSTVPSKAKESFQRKAYQVK